MITYDNTSTGSSADSTTTTVSHTVGAGDNRMLVVSYSGESNTTSDITVNSVTYNGVALTHVVSRTHSAGTGRSEIWALKDPDVGTHDIVLTTQTATSSKANLLGAVSVFGAGSITPEVTATLSTNGGAVKTLNLITLTDGAWVFDTIHAGDNRSFTPGSGQTERFDYDVGGVACSIAGSTKEVATAGATSVTQQASGNSNRLVYVAAAFAPASDSEPEDLELNISVLGSTTALKTTTINAEKTILDLTSLSALSDMTIESDSNIDVQNIESDLKAGGIGSDKIISGFATESDLVNIETSVECDHEAFTLDSSVNSVSIITENILEVVGTLGLTLSEIVFLITKEIEASGTEVNINSASSEIETEQGFTTEVGMNDLSVEFDKHIEFLGLSLQLGQVLSEVDLGISEYVLNTAILSPIIEADDSVSLNVNSFNLTTELSPVGLDVEKEISFFNIDLILVDGELRTEHNISSGELNIDLFTVEELEIIKSLSQLLVNGEIEEVTFQRDRFLGKPDVYFRITRTIEKTFERKTIEKNVTINRSINRKFTR